MALGLLGFWREVEEGSRGSKVGQRWSLKLQRLAEIAASAPGKPHGSHSHPGLWSQADLGSNPEPAQLE